MKQAISFAIALAALVAAHSAAKADAGIGATMGVNHSLLRSDSINAISDGDSLVGSVISASYRLGELNGFTLAVGAELAPGQMTGDTFQQIETDLFVLRLGAGLCASYPLTEHISGFGRVTTGVEWATLSLSNPISAADPIEDGSRAATASTFGGFDLSFNSVDSDKPVKLGLRAEAGYTRSMSHTFAGHPAESDEDAIEISTVAARLGDINTSGWGYRISLVLRF